MNTPETNDGLGRNLNAWRVTPQWDPAFRSAVWKKIEAREGGSWVDYARSHAALTTGLTAVALLAGAWIGRERAHTQVEVDRALLAENYVRSLDARTMRMP